MIDDSSGESIAHPALSASGLVAGIGLRAAATADDLLSLIDTCLAALHARRADLVALATIDARRHHPALLAVARLLDIPVVALPAERLDGECPNPSQRVARLVAVPSVAEAAALSFGPLLVEKQRSGTVTCAISRYIPAWSVGRSSASSVASTLATSSAGP